VDALLLAYLWDKDIRHTKRRRKKSSIEEDQPKLRNARKFVAALRAAVE
jgi:hypothetical protein